MREAGEDVEGIVQEDDGGTTQEEPSEDQGSFNSDRVRHFFGTGSGWRGGGGCFSDQSSLSPRHEALPQYSLPTALPLPFRSRVPESYAIPRSDGGRVFCFLGRGALG